MAAKNSIKSDIKNGFYHVYNRGVGKMAIFNDDQDYGVMLSYLEETLSPPPDEVRRFREVHVEDHVFSVAVKMPKNFYNRLVLLCYCLMPNHIHFVIKQLDKGAMKDFLHSILMRYSMYFNKKYNRVGPLFQGRYKAVFVEKENYLIYLSKYIHLNPSEYTKDLINSKSSYSDYLKLRQTSWLDTNTILGYFSKGLHPEFIKSNSYKKFVEGDKAVVEIIRSIIID